MRCGHPLSPRSASSPQALSINAKIDKIQRYLPQGLTSRILSQKDKIEGERRQVTVMFCDMKGFTPLVTRLGPEKAYSVMDQVYEILIHKVHDFEGTVSDMTGDGVMALFGAPIALEDAPQRALRSALAIHRGIDEFNRSRQGKDLIRMRIGVNTGIVVVGTLGNDLRVEFKAVGDTVNLASRMEGLAEPGTTYVTENTFKLTGGLFRFESLGKKEVKGVREPIPVYKLLSTKENLYRPRLGSERMIFSQMVGRDRELDRLELQVMKAVNGEGSVINIIGEAGIGKSRLVAELKRRESTSRATVLEGRAIQIGKNLSFYPIIDLFKQWAQIREGDDEAAAFGKLLASVRSLCPEDLGEVLPFVATLMGMKLPGQYAERVKGIEGESLENLILLALRKLLIKATELTPLVIIVEDLHWADTSSIELLESLFRLAETRRILFINVFRPGSRETGDLIARGVQEKFPALYVEIVLEPLDEKMSLTLIANMLSTGSLHHAVLDKILQRAGGNPFFIEEVVRSFIDEGVLVLKHGNLQATEGMSSVSIPNTISGLLMTRIDRLEEETRDLVKIASVIGRSFFYRILSEVAGKAEEIDGRLAHLKEIEIIRQRERMGEIEYLFKHALAQEAVYDSILPPKRKELHLRVASSIEKVFGERLHEFYGMLAYHYSRAESPEKTEEYLLKAGEEALKSSASSEALHYYQEALKPYAEGYDASADPEKVAMIRKNIALAQYNRGHYEESLEYFDKALDYYWGGLPSRLLAPLHFASALFHFLVSLYLPSLKFKKTPTDRDKEAVDLFFKKLKALAVINPMKYFVESFHFYKRVTKYDLTKFELGLGLFVGASTLFSFTGISYTLSKKILDLFKDKADKNHVRSFIIYDFSKTMHNYLGGDWEAIEGYDDELVNKNLSMGELYWTSQHFFWHGCPKQYQGCFDITSGLVEKLTRLSDLYENDLAMLLKYLLKTNLLMDSGKLSEALMEIEKGIEFGQKVSQGSIRIEMCSRKAHILLLMGEMEQAEKSLKAADEVRKEIRKEIVPWQLTDFSKGQFEYDLSMLKRAMTSGSRGEASEYRRKAKKSGKRLLKISKKVAQNRTDTYKLLGVYCWLTHRQKKALRWWEKAISEGERLSARPELSRTYFEVGKHLLERDSEHKELNGMEAEEYLRKASLLFQDMGLMWDLGEIDRLRMTEQGAPVSGVLMPYERQP